MLIQLIRLIRDIRYIRWRQCLPVAIAVMGVLCLSAWLGAAAVSEPALNAKVVPGSGLTVGDILVLTVSATHPEGWTAASPPVGERLGEFQVRERRSQPLTVGAGGPGQEWILSLTCYRTGRFEIPEIRATFTDPQGRTVEKATRPIAVEIQSILKDEKAELKDLKPQIELPEDTTWLWLLLLAVLILGAAALLARRVLSRRGKPLPAAAPAAPKIPPHEEARLALEALLARNLPAQGLLRLFYFELSEIIRRMVGRQYRIVTLERTTAEIIDELRTAPHEPLSAPKLEGFLERCDLIKFAKHEPLAGEQNELLKEAKAFIENVRTAFENAARAASAAASAAQSREGRA